METKHQKNLDKENLNKSLKRIVKTSFIVFIGVFLSKILAYAYRIIIARSFGPEVYGLYSLAITVLSLFVFSFSFGLADGLLRFIPIYRTKDEKDKIKKAIISVKGGHVGVSQVRDLIGVIKREKAEMGIFITLEPFTKPMEQEAILEGFYSSPLSP